MECAVQVDAEAEKLRRVIDRKDKAFQQVEGKVREIWALSWLARHASDSGLAGFNAADLAEAHAFAIDQIVEISVGVRAACEAHHGAYASVLHGKGF